MTCWLMASTQLGRQTPDSWWVHSWSYRQSCTGAPRRASSEPTEAEAEADPEDGDMHEADMDEPADAEPTAAEYQSFFDSILALP